MRTVLNLDAALARRLERIAKETGRTFEKIVNEALGCGLDATEEITVTRSYRLTPVSLGGVREGIDLTKAWALVDALEQDEI